MKKILLSLTAVAVVSMSANGLVSVAKADNPFGNTYKWATTNEQLDYINPVLPNTPSNGWPFDDGHFKAEFFGNQSIANSNQWFLQHYHVIVTQPSNQYGDQWYFKYVQAWDGGTNTISGPFDNNPAEPLPATYGYHRGVNGNGWVTKSNNSIRFYLQHNMKSSTGSIQTAIGSKYRNNF